MFKKFKKTCLFYLFLQLSIISVVMFSFNNETPCKIFDNEDLDKASKASFRLTDIVCSYVRKLYVNPEKIESKKMVIEALTRLEKSIPELLVDFDDTSETISVNVDKNSFVLHTKNIQTIKDTSSALKKAFAFIAKNKLTEKVSADDIMYEGLNGMLTQLDPHTVVLPPKDFNEFKIGTSGQFGGLGMVVGIRDGILTVISPIEGTPAYEAGLKPGDQIIEIDGESTINMTLSESVSKLRGKPNTTVAISVVKYKVAKSLSLSIERKIIRIPTVDDKVLEDGIGYIKIRNFQNDTSKALAQHIENLKKNNREIRGMIIDLRNNSGGLLDQAIQVTDQFIDSGNIVITVGPGGKNKDIQKARKSKSDELDFPIVLLINSSSASGAEIVVGALKENNRGVVIGNRSFGKGTVQQLIDLIDGAALKLTMAKYLTPLFNEVQSKGISPDILFTPVTISEENINLFKDYTYIREEDLLKHEDSNSLKSNNVENKKISKEIKYLLEIPEESEKDDEEEPAFVDEDPYKAGDLSKDRLVQFAKLLIKHTQETERNAILKDIELLLKKVEAEEEKKIFDALKEIGIDWSLAKPNGLPGPVANLSLKLASDKPTDKVDSDVKRVSAGEELTITVNVSNEGNGTMYRTRAITESENIYLDKLEFVFGMVKSGETKSYTKTVDIPRNAIDREDEVLIKFDESNGYTPNNIKKVIRIDSLPKPRFAYSYQISDLSSDGKAGNNDGLIQKDEDIRLTLIVRNIGEGISEKTSVSLKDVSDDSIFVKKGMEDIGELLPNETKTVDMEFKVKKEISADKFNMAVLIRESTFGRYTLSTLTFQIADEKKTAMISDDNYTLKITRDNTPVFGTRWQKSEQITSLDKDTTVKSDGRFNGLYRINFLDRYGWISVEDCTEKEESAKESNLENIELTMQHVPPLINIDTEGLEFLSDLDKLVITGTVDDDKEVTNVFAFVNDEKVYYKSWFAERQSRHAEKRDKGIQRQGTKSGVIERKSKLFEKETKKSLEFSTEVFLKEGPNTVTFIARDNEGLVNSKSLILTKRPTNVSQGKIFNSGG